MYSRKYIRTTPPSGAMRTEPSAITLPTPPPDYAGIAFRASEDRSRQDYPETVIAPQLEESVSDTEQESAIPCPLCEAQSGERPFELGERLIEPSDTLPPSIEAPSPSPSPEEECPKEENAANEPSDEGQELPFAFPTSASSAIEWLRALRLEDLMIFWMLLMLLYGEDREEIDLLLCLLLFAGH